jgi:UDP-glucuronate 4-epimerase
MQSADKRQEQTMRILITGTAGFIGHHIALRMVKEGHSVTGIDNLNHYYDVELKGARLANQGFQGPFRYGETVTHPELDFKFIKLDLTDREGMMELFRKGNFEYVINLAAQAGVRYSLTNPQVYIDSNVTGFLNVLEACRKYPVKHLVFASSSSVYGLNTKTPFSVTDHTSHPISLYAASKKSNELMAHTYSHLFQIPVTGLRFFTVFGPWGRPDMALYIFTKAIMNDEPLDLYNNGDMMRDFTYVDDIAESIFRLLPYPPAVNKNYDHSSPVPGSGSAAYRLFNIGNHNPVRLMELIHAIEKAAGKKAIIQMKPLQAGDLESTFADVEDLFLFTGFRPSTTLTEGVNRFVSWYREYAESSMQASGIAFAGQQGS